MPLTPEQAQDEVNFWLVQEMEHVYFLTVGLEDPQLKGEADQIYAEYRKALEQDPPNFAAAAALLPQSQYLKRRALAEANTRWIGWLYPALIDHMIREIDTMLLRTSPEGLTPRQEICVVDQHGAEVAAVVSHLLDPTEIPLQEAARTQARTSGMLAAACETEPDYPALLTTSKSVNAQLDLFASDPRLLKAKSILFPSLAAHEQREGQRYLALLNTLPVAEGQAPVMPTMATMGGYPRVGQGPLWNLRRGGAVDPQIGPRGPTGLPGGGAPPVYPYQRQPGSPTQPYREPVNLLRLRKPQKPGAGPYYGGSQQDIMSGIKRTW